MTGSAGSPTPAATRDVMNRVWASFCGGDNSYSNKDVMQAILDEEGPEALVEAVLDAAGEMRECPYVVRGEEGTSYCELAEDTTARLAADVAEARATIERLRAEVEDLHYCRCGDALDDEHLYGVCATIVTQLADARPYGSNEQYTEFADLRRQARENVYTNPAGEGE